MTDVTSKNLQIRLLILVFLAFIPALAFFWYANRETRALQLQAQEGELLQRVQVTAAEYRRMIKESEGFLGTLAEFPEIRTAQTPTCTERLRGILPLTPHYTTISVIGLDGYLSCGGLVTNGDLFLGDRAYFIQATTLNRFAVGEFALGRITGKPVLGLALPYAPDGELQTVVATSLDLGFLGASSARNLPEEHTFTVLDRNGQVMVRLPATGDFTLADSIGAMAGEDFPALPEARGSAIVTGTDLDGVERLFAVASLQGEAGEPQGYVAVGRTRMTLMEEVDRMVGLQLRYLAGGAILLLALAWVLGHFWLVRGSAESSAA
ncbi:hypothetical protein ACFL3S_06420 [Gemmatimonadota bacterium]